ncbi:MAG: hypothetical protein AAFR04_09435 [Pseudomonadota bacterium]
MKQKGDVIVTFIDAAAPRYALKRLVTAALVASAGLTAAGCAGNTGLGDVATKPVQPPTTPALTQPATKPRATVAIANIIGTPESVSQQLRQAMVTAVGQERVAISSAPGAKVDYTLRGYVVAAREGTGTKVSYIWDVTDPSGRRVNRITGEEVARGGSNANPWSAVSPAVLSTIATKTSKSFGSWLPAQQAVASNPAATQQPSGAGIRTPRPVTPAAPAATAQRRPAVQSVALRPGAVITHVPSVVGAPGDGSTSLTRAIRRELAKQGLRVSPAKATASYQVQGRVALGTPVKGKQSIKIDWEVRDPKGGSLGTVSQKNQIPAGSLNGSWGNVADAAAAAAAQGILKLLPRRPATF